MMKNKNIESWFSFLLTASLLFWSSLAAAIEFDEIREFGEVFKVSAKASDRQRIEVNWEIADGFYLYNNKFLRFKTETAGVVLGEVEIPAGKPVYDELLGEEVIKFHGH
ncbi:MAG: protein-disulfide reductase DsbD N-terminal domain-containing protein, partial [Lysobacterales bacterium]